MVLTFEQIKKLLPQRFPFLMLDRITEYMPDKKIIGVKNGTNQNNHTNFENLWNLAADTSSFCRRTLIAQTAWISIRSIAAAPVIM